VHPELSERVAALFSEEVRIAVAVDVARADQPLELFWLQFLAGELPLQLADDLVSCGLHNERARHFSLAHCCVALSGTLGTCPGGSSRLDDRPRLAAGLVEPVEARIGVRLHQAGIGCEVSIRVHATAVGGIEEHRRRRRGSGNRAVISPASSAGRRAARGSATSSSP